MFCIKIKEDEGRARERKGGRRYGRGRGQGGQRLDHSYWGLGALKGRVGPL